MFALALKNALLRLGRIIHAQFVLWIICVSVSMHCIKPRSSQHSSNEKGQLRLEIGPQKHAGPSVQCVTCIDIA